LLIAGIYYWLNRTVVPKVEKREAKKKKKGPKMSGEDPCMMLASGAHAPGLAAAEGPLTLGPRSSLDPPCVP
jgi:hypothetical protein